MPRPIKRRRVCHFPQNLFFAPLTGSSEEPVILTVDEFEVIRLIDREGLSQEDAAARLAVGRTTAQKIYENARKKIAEALVFGLPLKIEGGDYRLCDGADCSCPENNCGKRKTLQNEIVKGENTMRIAVTYENGEIFQHFGKTRQFKIYDIEENRVTDSKVVGTGGSGHGALAGVLKMLNADVLLCGGIGGGAKQAISEAGILLYGGISGKADDAVDALLNGKLLFDPNIQCNQHEHEHSHDCQHDCGESCH